MSTKYTSKTATDANEHRWSEAETKKQTVYDKLAKARASKNPNKEYDTTKPKLTTKTRKWPYGYTTLDNDDEKVLLSIQDFRMIQLLCYELQV